MAVGAGREPDFVPAAARVPDDLETPGVGRVVRLNNPVALRPSVTRHPIRRLDRRSPSPGKLPPVNRDVLDRRSVDRPTGRISARTPTLPATVRSTLPDPYGRGALATRSSRWRCSSFVFGTLSPPEIYFSGASQVGAFVAPTRADQQTRSPDYRPISRWPAECFRRIYRVRPAQPRRRSVTTRIDLLVADYLRRDSWPRQSSAKSGAPHRSSARVR